MGHKAASHGTQGVARQGEVLVQLSAREHERTPELGKIRVIRGQNKIHASPGPPERGKAHENHDWREQAKTHVAHGLQAQGKTHAVHRVYE